MKTSKPIHSKYNPCLTWLNAILIKLDFFLSYNNKFCQINRGLVTLRVNLNAHLKYPYLDMDVKTFGF